MSNDLLPHDGNAGGGGTTTAAPSPKKPAPNSKPRDPPSLTPVETYVYRDFGNVDDPAALAAGNGNGTDGANASSAALALLVHGVDGGRAPTQSLQNQKLPSKLGAMLCDPDLVSTIAWMPHGRSWKVLNRDLFSSFALPKYFGHSNHASFVRIVNAWGFRRISIGVDRDSYYHELFLRGKPQLHQRMKRLPSCHRKTPVDKEDRSPDFYQLAKASPLPEVTWSTGGGAASGVQVGTAMGAGVALPPQMTGMMSQFGGGGMLPPQLPPHGLGGSGMLPPHGLVGNHATNATAASTDIGMANNSHMISSLLSSSGGGGNATSLMGMASSAQLAAYTQNLQRENENLLLRIKLLEYESQSKKLVQESNAIHPASTIGGEAGINTSNRNGVAAGTTSLGTTALDSTVANSAPGSIFKQENIAPLASAPNAANAPSSTTELFDRELVMMQRSYGMGGPNNGTNGNISNRVDSNISSGSAAGGGASLLQLASNSNSGGGAASLFQLASNNNSGGGAASLFQLASNSNSGGGAASLFNLAGSSNSGGGPTSAGGGASLLQLASNSNSGGGAASLLNLAGSSNSGGGPTSLLQLAGSSNAVGDAASYITNGRQGAVRGPDASI